MEVTYLRMVVLCLWFILFASINCDERMRNPANVVPRIIGGESTTIESYPYQVAVLVLDEFYCGGSLISFQHVLSAAHCTKKYPRSYYSIRVGSSLNDEGGSVIPVSWIKSHPEYDNRTYDADLCIIKMSESVEPSRSISTIGLPNKDSYVRGGIYGIATGWGRLSNYGEETRQLRMVELPTLEHGDCLKMLTFIGFDYLLTDRMICIGSWEAGKGVCQGDSGGPFVIHNTLVGVTSWSPHCGIAGVPHVFTKVSSFLEFIYSNMN